MSSSGLVTPPASSAARRGNDTSKPLRPELVSATEPAPFWRSPFQVVVAVRVGIDASFRASAPRIGTHPTIQGDPAAFGIPTTGRALRRPASATGAARDPAAAGPSAASAPA